MSTYDGKSVLQDQAVSFHRPYPASLTALHEKQPEQGIFYRQDGTPFLKLWMKNACDVKIVIGQDTYILLEVERNLWEVKLPLAFIMLHCMWIVSRS